MDWPRQCSPPAPRTSSFICKPSFFARSNQVAAWRQAEEQSSKRWGRAFQGIALLVASESPELEFCCDFFGVCNRLGFSLCVLFGHSQRRFDNDRLNAVEADKAKNEFEVGLLVVQFH